MFIERRKRGKIRAWAMSSGNEHRRKIDGWFKPNERLDITEFDTCITRLKEQRERLGR